MMTECPNCKYDMYSIYDKVLNGHKSKYCKIVDEHPYYGQDFIGTCYEWYVECTCPKCKTKFGFSDSNV